MNDHLAKTLKKLRLSGLLESLEVRLHEAQSHQLNQLEFLELILQDELAVRSDRQRQRRVKAAGFRELKSLEDFDWSFNPSVPKKRVYELATGRYLQEARDVLWLGPPGVGKSFLVQALGYQAIRPPSNRSQVGIAPNRGFGYPRGWHGCTTRLITGCPGFVAPGRRCADRLASRADPLADGPRRGTRS